MYTSTQIAKMIAANVKAMETGIITWEQFGTVQRATWDCANTNRKVQLVQKKIAA